MQDKLEMRTFLVLLVLVTIWFFWMVQPFFMAIFWACAIAVIFYPLQQRFLKRFNGRENLAALCTLLTCIFIVVIPMLLIIGSVVAEGVVLYDRLKSGEVDPARYIEQVRTAFPHAESFLARFDINLDKLRDQAVNAAMTSGKFIASYTISIGQNAFNFIIMVCLMLYLTFFIMRDGVRLVDLLIRALPLGDRRERQLFAKFVEVTRAAIKGNMVVAMVQGALGGLIFWVLGIQGAILWGVLMAFASLIPAVGAAIVWVPFAIYLFAIQQYGNGIILIAFGAGVIGLVDNLLRPLLVGRDTRMPDYLILLSTLGGIALFGISGFVIGPVLAALFISFWGIFIREFQGEDASLHPTSSSPDISSLEPDKPPQD